MQHMYYDVSNLNAPYDAVPLQGLGGGILTTGSLGSLGATPAADTPQDFNYPWMAYSADTKKLQSDVNVELKNRGYCTLTTDGKLGPATCGAVKQMIQEAGASDVSPPETCKSFTAPRKPPCTVAPTPTNPSDTPPVVTTSSSSDSTWLIVGGLVAAAAVGGALYFKKHRR